MKKVGLFGGSFDPIHFGHLSLAVRILEEQGLDEILFCPAFCSPFKTKSPPIASGKDRLEMLKLCLDHPQFKISSLEIDRAGISYTIDTVKQLKGVKLNLLISEETAKHLDQWQSSKELIGLAPPLIGKELYPISSTMVRKRLKSKKYCSHLVPKEVLDYIRANRLYSS